MFQPLEEAGMSIEIRHLKAAVATADAKSFSRAAKVLSVKQSALSRRVQTLEQMLGVQLFDRTKRGTFPTENGKAFLTVARRIVTDIDNLITTAKNVSYGEEAGACRLSIASVCNAVRRSQSARGAIRIKLRTRRSAPAGRAGPSASSAPLIVRGVTGQRPVEGVWRDRLRARQQGKAFPS
jgi:DNA-binding transcriptional LysR family regulator